MAWQAYRPKPPPIEAACEPATRCRELRCDLGLSIREAAERAQLSVPQWHAAEDAIDLSLALACRRWVEIWCDEATAAAAAFLAEVA